MKNKFILTDEGYLKVEADAMSDGIVKQDDDKLYLIGHDELVKSLPTWEGKPVIMEHEWIDSSNVGEREVGTILSASKDSNYVRVKLIIKNPEAVQHILEKFNRGEEIYVSTGLSYDPKVKEKSSYNNIDIHGELTGIVLNHLGIVDNPRYENAKLIMNSKKGGNLMDISWKKILGFIVNKAAEEEQEKHNVHEDGKDHEKHGKHNKSKMIKLKGGKEIPLDVLLKIREKKKKEHKKNEPDSHHGKHLTLDSYVEHDGEKKKVRELLEEFEEHELEEMGFDIEELRELEHDETLTLDSKVMHNGEERLVRDLVEEMEEHELEELGLDVEEIHHLIEEERLESRKKNFRKNSKVSKLKIISQKNSEFQIENSMGQRKNLTNMEAREYAKKIFGLSNEKEGGK